jgi:hypothetical protein
MKRSEYEIAHKDVLEFLEQLDEEDRKFVLVDYETEEAETSFRWEYQCESLSEADSVFRRIYPDD